MQSRENISATLGSNQLQAGLLAGLIGLALVVVYSLFQYRALGSLTVASLAVAAVVTYLLLTLLSWRQGYRLSLAGVAGVIVAVGITADSFIVYFERIRDALRDGFTLEGSRERVEEGIPHSARLRRHQLSRCGDSVHSCHRQRPRVRLHARAHDPGGRARGRALHTHPMMTLLARTKFYRDGHPPQV